MISLSTISLAVIVVGGIFIVFASLWLNLDAWKVYRKLTLETEEYWKAVRYLESMQTGTNKALLQMRRPPRVFSPSQKKKMADVIKFNSAKRLSKLLNNNSKGDNT